MIFLFIMMLFLCSPRPSSAYEDIKYFGLYSDGVPQDLSKLASLENSLGTKSNVLLYYQDWTIKLINQNVYNVFDHGAIPLITWIPCIVGDGVNQPQYRLDNITAGNFDSYIRTSARAARDTQKTIWIRPFHEMNGNWSTYGGTVNGNEPKDFIPAWRHVVNIFRQEGANNIKFVWSPNTNSIPDIPQNEISVYYPGDNYVDLIAIDGYNWGKSQDWSRWNSFYQTFIDSYNEISSISNRPMIIGETACTEIGGDKPAWINEAFKSLVYDFPNIIGFNWFNVNKETDWRINSSSASFNAFKEGINKYYQYTPPKSPTEPITESVQFIIKFKADTSHTRINQIIEQYNLTIIYSKGFSYLFQTEPNVDFNELASDLSKVHEVQGLDRNHSYYIYNNSTIDENTHSIELTDIVKSQNFKTLQLYGDEQSIGFQKENNINETSRIENNSTQVPSRLDFSKIRYHKINSVLNDYNWETTVDFAEKDNIFNLEKLLLYAILLIAIIFMPVILKVYKNTLSATI